MNRANTRLTAREVDLFEALVHAMRLKVDPGSRKWDCRWLEYHVGRALQGCPQVVVDNVRVYLGKFLRMHPERKSDTGCPCARVGMRVDVFSGDRRLRLGLGTITRVCKGHPWIRLDTGENIGGSECWWHPVVIGLTPGSLKKGAV